MNITEHTKKNKMKLFTKEIDKKLFEQYPKGNDLENQIVVAKIFNPYGRGKWYLLNSDPQDHDYVWAIVDLFEVETGSISRSELESIKVRPFNLGLERDLSWTPKPAMEVLKGLQNGKYFEQGGTFDSSNSGDGIGGTSDSSEIGETIGGTAASSIMERGGGIYKVGDTFVGTPNAKYDESWQLYKPSTSYVIDGATKKVLSVHKTPMDAINARGTETNKVDYKVYPKEHYENKMAKGGNIKQIKVGEEYRYFGSNYIEKDIMDKIRPQLSGLKFAGNFSGKGWKEDGYLYFLDDYDQKLVKDIVLNPSERIYRYYTRNTAIGGMIPLVKINLDNGLIYFNEANDFGDETIRFSTKGQKSEYINLVKATDEDYYAKGGSIDKFNNQEFIIETTMQTEHIFAKNEDEAIDKWNKLHSRDTIKDSIVSIKKAYSEGGGLEDENREMVLNENNQIKHHTEELPNAIKGKKVPAWVVAKVHESASDLSDATHYMDGEKMANGGGVGDVSKSKIAKMQKINIKGLGGWMPNVKDVYYDNESKKFYFADSEGDFMELKNTKTLEQLDIFMKKNNITLDVGNKAGWKHKSKK